MSLEAELALLRAQRESYPPELLRVIQAALERLAMLQVAEGAPGSGELFPDFALADATGQLWRSEELLERGPLVVAFFRGGWCEYCDVTIRAVDRVAREIAGSGAGLVGIVPEKGSVLAATVAEKAVGFPLLTDAEGRLAKVTGLQFSLSPEQVRIYRETRGLDLPARHAGTGWELPVPGAYVVRQDGTVAFAFADIDYTRRAEPDALVQAVRELGARSAP